MRRLRFPPGRLIMTPEAEQALAEASASAQLYFERHLRGDWGDVVEFDRQHNDVALQHGDRLVSRYALPQAKRLEP